MLIYFRTSESEDALCLAHPPGENSIIIVGGANQASWSLSEAAKAEITKAGKVLKLPLLLPLLLLE